VVAQDNTDAVEPSLSHWKTSDAEMNALAASALIKGRSGGGDGQASAREGDAEDRPAQGSSMRRRLREITAGSAAGQVPSPIAREADPLAGEAEPPAPDTREPVFDRFEEPGDDDRPEPEALTPFDEDDTAPPGDEEGEYGEGSVSQFEYRAPFTRRRSAAKMWTAAAAIFAVLALGTVLAVNYLGLPQWLPFNQPTFGIGKPDLVLEFPQAQQRTELLDNGEEIFRVRGSINNVGREAVSVPRLMVVFFDERDRPVFNWEVSPAKSTLAPGETLNVTEAISDIPENAHEAAIGWSPR
jgi:hypothetical protein